MRLFYYYLAAVNLLAFLAMGADKRKAKAGARRTPEATLVLLACIGGAAGGWLGMRVFHHKTKHAHFRIGFPLLTVLEIAAVVCLILYSKGVF